MLAPPDQRRLASYIGLERRLAIELAAQHEAEGQSRQAMLAT
ncbi:hypothetical protein ACFOKI_06800 [Sphingomonas qilianensis]|uniref:Uncharacterized protein n=1 Tax=Sphingomonas qilianensis TaxID=1736690 RepID=A0ABU9XQJ7_9SPHN